MQSEDVTLWLQYSKNNGKSGYYIRYDVELRNGVVVGTSQDVLD